MKTSNYLAKLPQEATIKNVQSFRDYDLITLDVPAPRQRLCPHCGSTDCVIVYCIIKFPKVAEAIPQSCRGNFPNNAAVFGASLSLLGWQIQRNTKHPLQAYSTFCILGMSLQTTFKEERSMIAMDKVHSIRQLFYEQGKSVSAIAALK